MHMHVSLIMGQIGIIGQEYEHDFGRLLDAALNEPHKVPTMVAQDRDILIATNRSGENALAWLALENQFEQVILLRNVGSPIPHFALYEAIELLNIKMIILLLELGVDIDIYTCRSTYRRVLPEMTRKQRRLIRSYFSQFGYDIDSLD